MTVVCEIQYCEFGIYFWKRLAPLGDLGASWNTAVGGSLRVGIRNGGHSLKVVRMRFLAAAWLELDPAA